MKIRLIIGIVLMKILFISCVSLNKNTGKTIFIASKKAACQGVVPMECMQVKYLKKDKAYTFFMMR